MQHLVDSLQQLRACGVLEDEPGRPQLKRSSSQIRVVLHGQEYELYFWTLLTYSFGSIQSV